jgi:glycosyltransferase involved in cell wall biosynthesis
LPHGKKIYTFIGRLTSQKQPLKFLELSKNRLTISDECYVLVGDGELASQALAFISKNSLNNVIRIPYIENTLELNAVSDGIVFTSEYEGLPIAMLEAISMGVPVFSTDVGDIADVLKEYGGGEVVQSSCNEKEFYEAFSHWLHRCKEYANNLISQEHRILDRFSSINIAKQYETCWENAIKSYNKNKTAT